MQTVFSHIIQNRFSQVNEDVATDALAYILESSDAARNGMTKFLRGIVADLPPLRFKTQQMEGAMRPDMWGFAEADLRVFIENKFWAGLTDNQPVSYMEKLAEYPQPTVLLIVAPAAREQTLWRELNHRLHDAGIVCSDRDAAAGVAFSLTTELGPVLALTSWTSVLSVLEHETVDDPMARADLVQLQALCDAADNDAFVPVSAVELSDQRTPAFMLQLSSIVQATVDLAVSEEVLSIHRLLPQASWERIGRYARVGGNQGPGAWFGIHFGLWKAHGATPLWVVFSEGDFGRAQEIRPFSEAGAAKNGLITANVDQGIAIELEIPVGEEKAGVIRSLADRIKAIAALLDTLPPISASSKEQG